MRLTITRERYAVARFGSESESLTGVDEAGSCGDVSFCATVSKMLATLFAVFADDSTNSMPLLQRTK